MFKKILAVVIVLGCMWGSYQFEIEKKASQYTMDEENFESLDQVEVEVADRRAASVEEVQITATAKKIKVLKEILALKNDNDPRLDTELKNLTNEDKDALVQVYKDLKPESLNDKGTIVFLIGRELTRPEDAEFLKNVLSEEPCLSFDNCGITNPETDPHMDSVNNVTLNYPQVVALNRIKSFIQTQDLQTVNPGILSHLVDATKIGQSSKVNMVKNRSQEIAEILSKKNN